MTNFREKTSRDNLLKLTLLMNLCIFQAVDIDLPPNNNVKFSITSGDPLGNFTIGETSGKIQVTGSLDYESMDPALKGAYTLEVTAKDMGATPLSSTAIVLITVQVENEFISSYDLFA